jgi:putative transcriptional regulator
MAASTAGRLLIATPAINDGNFDHSVIFMLHHDPVGALGVVINRPSPLTVEELLPRWVDLACEPAVVFDGGPVEPNGFIGVAKASHEMPDDAAAIPSTGGLATIDLESDPAITGAYVERLRIFRGYAGWAPHQLDGEISAGAWFIVDVDADDLWTDTPGDLCERVLSRQRGTMRWFANAPRDPSLN